MNNYLSSLSRFLSLPPRVCVSVSRRWWRCTNQTGVRPGRTGPSTCFPHKTGEFSVFLLQTVYSRGLPSSPSAPTETSVQVKFLSWLCECGGRRRSQTICLFTLSSAFSDGSLVMSARLSFLLFVILGSLIDCGLPVVGTVFVCVVLFSPSCQCAASRNAPEHNTKEKWLSHPIAHSLDSPCADGHSREAGTGGCVLASWQVPSVMQGLCVLVVLGHKCVVFLHVCVGAYADCCLVYALLRRLRLSVAESIWDCALMRNIS